MTEQGGFPSFAMLVIYSGSREDIFFNNNQIDLLSYVTNFYHYFVIEDAIYSRILSPGRQLAASYRIFFVFMFFQFFVIDSIQVHAAISSF